MITLQSPIIQLSIWAKKLAPQFKRLGLETVEELLFYYPFRYDDLSKITQIASLGIGTQATVLGQIQFIQNKRSRYQRKLITEALIKDDTGSIKAIWFNQPFITKILKVGDWVYFSGKVDYQYETLQFIAPTYEKLSAIKREEGTTHTARIVPVYSLTNRITQKQIRYLIRLSLPLVKKIQDPIPVEILKAEKFLQISYAIKNIHFPTDKQALKRAIQRLKFDELFFIQLRISQLKQQLKKSCSPRIEFKEKETKEFVKSLPFTLTDDQKKAGWQILQDMESTHTMNRLLEGDVGSGKTVVAALAIVNAVLNGYQVAFMAPTEVLARQHFATLQKLFQKFRFPIALLTRSYKEVAYMKGSDNFQKKVRQNKKDSEVDRDEGVLQDEVDLKEVEKITRKKMLSFISDGKISLVVGTHALLSQGVSFKSLALSIIDEQHRFGVSQRKALKDQCGFTDKLPHLLSMTATPIPRTLYLTLYGDLKLSIIKELPKGRKKIKTQLVSDSDKAQVYKFILSEIRRGRQAFVICPLIDPSDKLGVKSVTQEYEKLHKKVFPDIAIGMLHGRLKTKEKEMVMERFVSGEIKILVSTSVIEVGVDIPNATVMVIEGAERFGLAQMHQFRGRVGRGMHQSYCFLFTDSESSETKKRLEALTRCEDGFELAKQDLEFRGAGEIYGQRQSGLPSLKIARLSDHNLIKKAQLWAQKILEKDPELIKHPLLKEKIQELSKETHLE